MILYSRRAPDRWTEAYIIIARLLHTLSRIVATCSLMIVRNHLRAGGFSLTKRVDWCILGIETVLDVIAMFFRMKGKQVDERLYRVAPKLVAFPYTLVRCIRFPNDGAEGLLKGSLTKHADLCNCALHHQTKELVRQAISFQGCVL